MKLVMPLFVTLCASLSLAGPLGKPTASVRGVDEAVIISYLSNGVWGYNKEMTGFHSGVAVTKMVPVTREAAAVLQSLDRSSQYECVIENSTYVAENESGYIKKSSYAQDLGGTYFVLDINCD